MIDDTESPREWNGFPEDYRRLEAKLDAVLAISVRVEEMATKVAGQIKPVLDDLMKSPLLKMLGVKAK